MLQLGALMKTRLSGSSPIGATFAVSLLATASFVSIPSLADDKPPCSGDKTACDILQISQRGTDPASGAHVVIKFDRKVAPGVPQQAIYMQLYLAKQKSQCGGNLSPTLANVNEGSSGVRSIDGYLCKLKATWERR
jgi:hypothetical protein